MKTFDNKAFLAWKRKNVSLRGIKELGEDNGAGAMFGKGLYTAALANKGLAKQYGTVYFLVNARPKNPKKLKSMWQSEVFVQSFEYDKIADEVQKLGYDGIEITGREYVSYNPENVLYFSNERQLENYFYSVVQNSL